MTTTTNRLESLSIEDRVSTYLRGALQPIPLLGALTAAGLLAIFGMGLIGILERLGWQIIAAAGLILVMSAAHVAIIGLAAQRRGLLAYSLFSVVTVATALLLTGLWQGIAALTILMAWMAPGTCIPAKVPRRIYAPSVAVSAVASAVILWLADHPIVSRLSSNASGSFAALLLLASMVVLFALLTVATQIIRYQTLRARLVVSLVPIIAVPIVFTTAVSAFNALTSNQTQFRNTLEAVSSLKQGQLDSLVGSVFAELGSIQQGSGEAGSILHVLSREGESDETYRLNASVAATLIRNVIVLHPASDYEEILVLDMNGNVVLSTYLLDEGSNFKGESFFQRGLGEASAQFIRFPGKQNMAGDYKLVAAAPFYASPEGQILGVVVAVARGDTILGILGPTAGLENAETYLVDEELRPIANVSVPDSRVNAGAITTVVSNRAGNGSSTYANYAGLPVLGYYVWDPALRAAVVTEVPQAAVVSRALAALLTSGLVGILTIVIAVIAVVSSSTTISEPVSGLASVAEHLATGHLTTRARTDRSDEIGKLANSFNAMANQLQTMIANLERRVAERTQDLELQTLRMRTAAEVARDATLARSLDELLDRAASLMLNRFDLNHSGIFLLDDRREQAVLRSAPSEAGRRMLAANYRVQVGAKGVVGEVAATGEPRLALDTDKEPAALGDEFHPATRSELALPLKTNEGLIGVLDLQSERADAFRPRDTSIMQVLADQIAAAIERSRLLLQVQERLSQLEQTYLAFTRQAWATTSRVGQPTTGYTYNHVRMAPAHTIPDAARAALEKGVTLVADASDQGSGVGQSASIPVRLRGATLGVINVNFQHGRAPERTIAMIEQAADRLATALENVRLLEDSLRRANKERVIGEISAKISSSMNMRNVLQTAVEELGRALPGSNVSIRFGSSGVDQEQETPS